MALAQGQTKQQQQQYGDAMRKQQGAGFQGTQEEWDKLMAQRTSGGGLFDNIDPSALAGVAAAANPVGIVGTAAGALGGAAGLATPAAITAGGLAGAAGLGYGAYEAGKGLFGALGGLGGGSGDDKAMLDKVSQQYTDLGQRNWGLYNEGLNKQLGEYGNAQNVYDSQSGYFNRPGQIEQLYSQRQGGNDPTFNYYSQQAAGQNARNMAAKGLGNSTYAAQTGNDMQAKLIADQQKEMGTLALNASNEQQKRMADQRTGQFDISQGRSKAIGDMYTGGIESMSGMDKNALAAQIAKLNISREDKDRLQKYILGGGEILAGGLKAGALG